MTAIEKEEACAHDPFSELNLIALRKYACVSADERKNEWYLECIGCEKNATCKVGQRVEKLLDEKTNPGKSQVQKFEEKLGKKKDMDFRKRFEEALKHDDPYQWLASQGYYKDRDSAGSSVASWCNTHKDKELRKKYSDIYAKRFQNGPKIQIMETRNTIECIFRTRDPEDRALGVLQGTDRKYKLQSVMSKVYSWARKYPDLNEKYGLYKIGGEISAIMTANKDCVTVGDFLDKLEKKEDEPAEPGKQPDEMTLEEFLDEAIEDSGKPEIVTPLITPAQENLRVQFSNKRQELLQQVRQITMDIYNLQAKQKNLQDQLHILDRAAAIFGMAPDVNDEKEETA